MARTDTEALVVSLEARVRDFERNFARAQRTADRSFRAVERRGEDAAERLERSMARAAKGMGRQFAGLGKTLLAGAAGGLAVGSLDAIVGRLGGIVTEVGNIGREARRAGVSTRVFQELGSVAARARIPIDSLVDGLKELNLRADEFVTTGKGPAAEAFERLGYSADELKRALAEPGDLLVEIIARMEDLDRAAQIRIADEIFGGTAGERFVELLGQGAEGIRAIIREAHATGEVLDADIIARAEEIDRRFAAISRTVSVQLKGAVVEAVMALDDFLDRFRAINDQSRSTITDRLLANTERRSQIAAELDRLRNKPAAITPLAEAIDNGDIARLEAELASLTDEGDRLTERLESLTYRTRETAAASDEAAPSVADVGEAASGAGDGAKAGADGFKGFADAVRALKDEIPGLAGELARLDAAARIDAAYEGAMANARTVTDRMEAAALRNEALRALDVQAAGSDSAAFLKTKLTRDKSAEHVDGLQATFADKLAAMIASAPKELQGQISIYSGFRSVERQAQLYEAALKKYGSEKAARKWVAPPGNSQHNNGNAADLKYGSEAAKAWVHRNAPRHGLAFPLGHEPWHVEDADARRRLDDDTARERYENARRAEEAKRQEARREADAAKREAERARERGEREAARTAERAASDAERATNDEAQRKLDLANDQAEAYQRITGEARAFAAEQDVEQRALSMTGVQAAALRYEHDMLAQAQRAGIQLTQQQRAEIAQLAQGMAQAEAGVQQYAASAEQANEVSKFFGQQAVDALTGLITGTMTAEQALKQLLATLVKAALQAAILGEGPLAGLFKGGGAGGGAKAAGGAAKAGAGAGKGAGGFLGSLLGFADGGYVSGPGSSRSDSIPARLSNGEYVVNAAATRKHRATLEAINSGRVPAFRDGGMVGSSPPAMAPPRMASTSDRAGMIVNAPITVNGSSGTPAQNDDLAKKMRKEMEATMRGVVADEVRQMRRAGNVMGR